jgi:hypothetical protein
MFHWDLSIKKVLYQHTQGLQHHFPKKSAEIGAHPMPGKTCQVADFTQKNRGLSSVPESSTTLHRCWPLAVPHKKHGLILMGFTLWLEENRPGDALHVFGTVKSN